MEGRRRAAAAAPSPGGAKWQTLFINLHLSAEIHRRSEDGRATRGAQWAEGKFCLRWPSRTEPIRRHRNNSFGMTVIYRSILVLASHHCIHDRIECPIDKARHHFLVTFACMYLSFADIISLGSSEHQPCNIQVRQTYR